MQGKTMYMQLFLEWNVKSRSSFLFFPLCLMVEWKSEIWNVFTCVAIFTVLKQLCCLG